MGEAPEWTVRLAYAEQFHCEPHNVNPPLRWWYRWALWRMTQAQRDAFRFVNEHGKAKATPEQNKLYDSLILP